MNRSFLIIGVPAVGVATFYAAALWGRWVATGVAIALSLLLGAAAIFDQRRRAARRTTPAGRG